jgi:hypothetical protein
MLDSIHLLWPATVTTAALACCCNNASAKTPPPIVTRAVNVSSIVITIGDLLLQIPILFHQIY